MVIQRVFRAEIFLYGTLDGYGREKCIITVEEFNLQQHSRDIDLFFAWHYYTRIPNLVKVIPDLHAYWRIWCNLTSISFLTRFLQ